MAGRKTSVTLIVRVPETGEELFLNTLRIQFPTLSLQLLSLRHQPNARRIEMIAKQTIRSKKYGSLLAARPELDLLLRLAGTTQISVAFEKVGYKNRGGKVLVAVGAPRDLKKLEKLADENPEMYKRSRGTELTSADFEAIEGAALLGVTRS